MRLRKTSAVIAAGVAAALSLAACDGRVDSGASGAAASAPPSTPGSEGAPSGSAAPGATPGPDATEGSGRGDTQASASASSPAPRPPSGDTCRTADLSFSSSGGMAEGEVLINLRNSGSTACSMRGFPGLDLKGEAGTVSAGRSNGRSAPTVRLAPGEGTNFSLHFPPDTGGGSGAVFTSALVTPPNETRSHRMSLSVGVPADPGSAARITVDPVGSGK
ncbi:DUF4232 domain-containing protein [Streptomyces sp. NPDC058008]|uniref:DUF4232 domain-containing protein n=1 Tax=Streptomyces sp. NPDC058008 TaxID=3346303 RepID=UPI0036EB8F3F